VSAGSLGFRRRLLAAAGMAVFAFAPARAHAEPPPSPTDDGSAGLAEEPMPPPGYVPGHQTQIGLGLSPHVPDEVSILPSGIMPSFGAPLRPADGGRFEFHGYVQAGGRAGFNSRRGATSDQSSIVVHGDPVVPRGNVFENTNNVPYTWSELRFSYVTPVVTSTVTLGAWQLGQAMQASGSFVPNAQLWVRDAFVAYQPRKLGPVALNVKVGVYEDRYGWMEQYSSGAYGAPLVASIYGVGETIQAELALGAALTLELEQGIKGQLARTPPDVGTRAENNWAKPWEGNTLVNHLHVGLDYKGIVNPAFHYVQAFARDDQGDGVALGNLRANYENFDGGTPPANDALDHADGSLRILAADSRFRMRRFGYLYVGVSSTSVDHVRTLNNVVQIQNAGGGRDLMDRYFGRNNANGRGSLLLAGAEYQVSLGELLRYPDEFWGEGPDLKLSVFGMVAHVTSDDPARDGQDSYKLGVEGTYSFLPWLAASGRIDHSVPYAHRPEAKAYAAPPGSVPGVPDSADPLCYASGAIAPGTGAGNYRCYLYAGQTDNTFSVFTAKLIFRSEWSAREALTLQYSRYVYGSHFHLITLNSGGQVSNQTDHPDQDLFAIYGTLWW